MEINRLGEQIWGIVPVENVMEGRFGLFVTHGWDYDFGSNVDLPGWRRPLTIEEANRARYIITWAVNNRPTPLLYPMPHPTFSTRQGFGTAANAPWAAAVMLTYPGNQNCMTIPSGVPSLAMAEGVFTLLSGCYIDNPALHFPGAPVVVANFAEDGPFDLGKPKYQATMDERVVGFTIHWQASNGALTIQTFD